jgi:hypothetical protein
MRLYITRQFILPFPQKLPKHGKGLFFLMNTHVNAPVSTPAFIKISATKKHPLKFNPNL